MDLSFSRYPFRAGDAVPSLDAATLLAALVAHRRTVGTIDHTLFSPADGAFNGRVAQRLTAWQG